MDKLKQWIAFTVVGVLAVLAAGWFLLVAPKRADADTLNQQAATQTTANSGLQTQLALLKSQAKKLPLQQAKLAAVAAKIPDNPAEPALIRALDSAATAAGVELVSIAPGQPTAAVVPGAAGVVVPGASATAGTSTAAGAGGGTLQSISLSINVVGGYFQLEQFFNGLENLSRATKVTGFVLTPGANPVKPGAATGTQVADGKSITTTITAQVYMAAGRPTAVAVTVPGQPVAPSAVAPTTVASTN